MKKNILLLFASFIILSCTPDEKGNRYYYEILKVESYEVPVEFVTGSTISLTVRYKRPTSCHYFNNLYYHRDTNIRTIAIESIVEERNNCVTLVDPDNPIIERTFNFQVLQAAGTTYVLKFYKGKDASGTNIYEEVTVPVID